MRKNLNEIDDLFLQGLQHLKSDPSQSVWEHINLALNKKDAQNNKRKYNQLKRVSIVLSILLISLVLKDLQWNYQFKESKNSPGPVESPKFIDIPLMESRQIPADSKSVDQGTISIHLYNSPEGYNQSIEKNGNKSVSIPINSNSLIEGDPYIETLTNHTSTTTPLQVTIPALGTPGNFHSLATNGDENKIEHVLLKGHRLSLAGFFSADIIGNRLNEEYEYDNQRQSDIEGRENDDLSFTAGLSLQYHFSRKWFFYSGLSFSNTSSWINPVVLNARPDHSGAYKFKLVTTYGLGEITKPGNAMPVSGDSIRLNSTFQELNYITLPFGVGYTLSKGKFSLTLNGAAGLNLITKGVINVDISQQGMQEKENYEKIAGLRKGFITAIAGGTLGYAIKKNWLLNFGPVVRYAVTPINENTPIKNYPNNLGLILGLTAKF